MGKGIRRWRETETERQTERQRESVCVCEREHTTTRNTQHSTNAPKEQANNAWATKAGGKVEAACSVAEVWVSTKLTQQLHSQATMNHRRRRKTTVCAKMPGGGEQWTARKQSHSLAWKGGIQNKRGGDGE